MSFKEGWPGMLISGDFMALIDRPGWLILTRFLPIFITVKNHNIFNRKKI
jgi:hypothetical protein